MTARTSRSPKMDMNKIRMKGESQQHKNQQRQKQIQVVKEERWFCDVCKIASFVDYDEACRHEENCTYVCKKDKEVKIQRVSCNDNINSIGIQISSSSSFKDNSSNSTNETTITDTYKVSSTEIPNDTNTAITSTTATITVVDDDSATKNSLEIVNEIKDALTNELTQGKLPNSMSDESKVRCFEMIERLGECPMTLEVLTKTLIGKVLSKFKHHKELGHVATKLVDKWKTIAKDAGVVIRSSSNKKSDTVSPPLSSGEGNSKNKKRKQQSPVVPVHPFFTKKTNKHIQSSNDCSKKEVSVLAGKEEVTIINVDDYSEFTSSDDTKRNNQPSSTPNETCQKRLRRSKKSKDDDNKIDGVAPMFQKNATASDNNKSIALRPTTKSKLNASPKPRPPPTTTKTMTKAKNNKPLASLFLPSSKSSSTKENNKRCSENNDDKFLEKGNDALLSEHRSAEFFLSRRRAAEANTKREAEKIRIRNESLLQQSRSRPRATTATAAKIEAFDKRYPLAPRFPVPSHVLGEGINIKEQILSQRGEEEKNSVLQLVNNDNLIKSREYLAKTLRYPTKDITIKNIEEVEDYTHDRLERRNNTVPPRDRSAHEYDALYEEMSSLLISRPSSQLSNDSRDNQLWPDKYGIQTVPEDVCGEKNCEAAIELLQFVDDWKNERQKALERMAEKRELLLASSKKKKKRKRKVDDDDDLWDDDEDLGLCNVCLLTGPTGSGKTSLVHAIANQSDCVVLEINTTDKRSGQALKHRIEEATQSHSSLAMLKKKKYSCIKAPFCFQNVPNDSIQDDESVTSNKEEVEDSNRKGPSVAVVLIDEVDNIFEDGGDSGFWPMLSTLAQKAMCPIFLTANRFPEYLESSSTMRFKHITTCTPTAMECASRMLQILEKESVSWRKDRFSDDKAAKTQLARIAQLCRCNLRRITLELQLFCFCGKNNSTGTMISNVDKDIIPCKPNQDEKQGNVNWDRPVISEVSPTSIPANECSLLTIKGENFLSISKLSITTPVQRNSDTLNSSKWELYIGGQICNAMQVMDDSTILAVCPPCVIPPGINESGMFKMTLMDCLTSRYAPVTLLSPGRNGILSSTDSAVTKTDLYDGNSILVLVPHTNVEYIFPLARSSADQRDFCKKGKTSSVDDEFEFDGPANQAPSCDNSDSNDDDKKVLSAIAPEGPDRNSKGTEEKYVASKENHDDKTMIKMLEQGIAKWEKRRKDLQLAPCKTNPTYESAGSEDDRTLKTSFDERVRQAEFSSDAAFLEESSIGLPFLSGASRGLGLLLTDEFRGTSSTVDPTKLQRNMKAKPPALDRLFTLGWNDSHYFFGDTNTFVTAPSCARDRMLLKRSEAFTRGMSLTESDQPSTNPHRLDGEDDTPEDPEVSVLPEGTDMLYISEEDSLFPYRTPPSLLDLPSFLREIHCGQESSSDNNITYLLQLERDNNLMEAIDLISRLLSEETLERTFFQGLTRNMNSCASLARDRLDGRLFLDYLPMLRCMSVYENSANEEFQRLLATDPDAMVSQSTRRTTRRNKKPRRIHHLERHFADHRLPCDVVDSTLKTLSKSFAKALLC